MTKINTYTTSNFVIPAWKEALIRHPEISPNTVWIIDILLILDEPYITREKLQKLLRVWKNKGRDKQLGREALQRVFRELRTSGFIKKEYVRCEERGRFSHVQWTLLLPGEAPYTLGSRRRQSVQTTPE